MLHAVCLREEHPALEREARGAARALVDEGSRRLRRVAVEAVVGEDAVE